MIYAADYARLQEPEYGPHREYPTIDEITAIARRHLAPAFYAMAEAIQKAAPNMGHTAFKASDISKLIECTVHDGVFDVIDSAFLNACTNGE